jgi:hypothetical protein
VCCKGIGVGNGHVKGKGEAYVLLRNRGGHVCFKGIVVEIRGSRYFEFLDFQYLKTEDQSRKGVFLYFHVLLPGYEFVGTPKMRKIH